MSVEPQVHLTKDGKVYTIRRPTESDAQSLIDYSKLLFASTDQVLTTFEEYTITLEGEKTWINNFNQSADSLALVAELEDNIIGLLFFVLQVKRKSAHTGEFGVSVHPDHQAIGVGRALVERLITWAKGHEKIEKVFLQVFASNTHAIKLYKDLGFIEEGRHVKAIRQPTGEYIDVLQMYLETK